MPDGTDVNKGGAGGDGTGAGAGAGSDNKGGDAGDGNKSGQSAGGDETITIKKADWEKTQADLKKSNEDRDNYKTGLLQKKADERDLNKGGQGGDGSGGQDQGAGNVIDEKKVNEVASAAASKTIRDGSEKSAKRTFLKNHSEYLDDAQWTQLMSHFSYKGGETTVDDVLDRFEAAILEHKRATGKLDEYLKSEHDRGVREGRIQGELQSGLSTGGAGDKNEGGKGTGNLSPKGEEMARAMHTDPEKVKKVDPSRDNVINEL